MNFSYLRREPGFYRRVFTLALPVVLQNLITTSLGFMDTFMVGLVGQEQMSAVTVVIDTKCACWLCYFAACAWGVDSYLVSMTSTVYTK